MSVHIYTVNNFGAVLGRNGAILPFWGVIGAVSSPFGALFHWGGFLFFANLKLHTSLVLRDFI